MKSGTISYYFPNKGYGLITEKNGTEHFFYSKDVEKDCCNGAIKVGEEIEFDPSRWNYYHAVHLRPEHKELENKLRPLKKDNGYENGNG